MNGFTGKGIARIFRMDSAEAEDVYWWQLVASIRYAACLKQNSLWKLRGGSLRFWKDMSHSIYIFWQKIDNSPPPRTLADFGALLGRYEKLRIEQLEPGWSKMYVLLARELVRRFPWKPEADRDESDDIVWLNDPVAEAQQLERAVWNFELPWESESFVKVMAHVQLLAKPLNLLLYDDQVGIGFLPDGTMVPLDRAEQILSSMPSEIELLHQAAEQGDVRAQHTLASMYHSGKGVEKDLAQAFAWCHLALKQEPRAPYLAELFSELAEQGHAWALAWLRHAAEHGDADVHLQLGDIYNVGRGVTQNLTQAVAWYRLALTDKIKQDDVSERLHNLAWGGNAQAVTWLRETATQGDAKALQRLGDMYRMGRGITRDGMQALACYRVLAERGDLRGLRSMAHMYQYDGGQDVARDLAQAFAWFRVAHEQGGECESDFYKLAREGSPEALAWLRQAAEQGNARAQVLLGRIYEEGDGAIEQDISQAVTYYWMAAQQNNTDATRSLGTMARHDDIAQAQALLHQAARQGNAEAMLQLGMMYAFSECVEADYPQAFAWLRSAFENGEASARSQIGHLAAAGYPEAVTWAQGYIGPEWLRQAAEYGNAKAMLQLGMMYAFSESVEADFPQAFAWLRAAFEDGEASARSQIGHLAAAGYPEAVAWAQAHIEPS